MVGPIDHTMISGRHFRTLHVLVLSCHALRRRAVRKPTVWCTAAQRGHETVAGEHRSYGACDFEVGGSPTVAEPTKCVRGELARAMLYMADQYGAEIRGITRDALPAFRRRSPTARLATGVVVSSN